MAEKFCLKWNDFQTNVSNTFRKLRTSEHFYDVTLVSDDQQQVSAHKVVLSSSSKYFETVLTSAKHSHPMLCLSGVNKGDLENILNFIYNGEIQIYQDNLDKFLDIAQRFQLQGLIQGKEENEENNDPFQTFEGNDEMVVAEEFVEAFPKQDKVVAFQETRNEIIKTSREKIISVQSSDVEELDQKIEDLMEKQSDGKYQCTTCGKISSQKSNAREHAETHIDGLSFPCQYCNKSFRSRKGLRYQHKCQHRQH